MGDARAGAQLGGIFQLVTLLSDERRPALIRDFREKFNISISDIGVGVRFDEAWDLILTLRADPASWFHAALSGWDYPLSYESIALRDLYDMQLQTKSKRKIKPYPRPWANSGKKLGGSNPKRTPSQVLAILRPAA